jgi:hypothetical protein
MKLTEAPTALKEFRETPWELQRTFLTPLKDLKRFVAKIVSASPDMRSGFVAIEQVVFEAKGLNSLLAMYSISGEVKKGVALSADVRKEVEALLEAAFSDWIDFVFFPEPRSFGIYADHDEYTTFFTHTRSDLDRIVEALDVGGFKVIPDWQRKL